MHRAPWLGLVFLLACGGNERCRSDQDCPAPQTCAAGVCADPACGVGAPFCNQDADCRAGQRCALGCCVARGFACTRDADCASHPATPVCDVAAGICVR